ncbi:MAG: hypothetical protein V3S83_12315 [Gemmatimonadota bacterium]
MDEADESTQEVKIEQKPEAGRTVQDRISQLVRQKHEAERGMTDLEAKVTAKDQELIALAAKVDALEKTRSAPQPKTGLPDPLGLATSRDPLPSPAPSVNVDAAVASAVAKALAPLVQGQEESARAQKIKFDQSVSFQEAAKDLPQVLVAGSKEETLFNEIWESHPDLHGDTQAPALIIHAIRGTLGGARDLKDQIERKTAATTPQPQAGVQRLSELPDSTTKSKEIQAKLIAKGKETPLSVEEQEILIGLQLGLISPKA